MASPPKLSSLVIVRLYRNLLRAAKPFTVPSPHAKVMNCLLSRTGIDDHIPDWNAYVAFSPKGRTNEEARDLSVRYQGGGRSDHESQNNDDVPPNRSPQLLFRRLLREVVCAGNPNGVLKSSWPTLVDPKILWNVIRREFRDGHPSCQSIHFSPAIRRKVAFMTLRELNKKLSYWDHLQKMAPEPLPNQAAWNVSKLPFTPPSAYLRPGVFLLAHPHMTDSFFAKAVICILEHEGENKQSSDEDEESALKRNLSLPGQQTYGLIVNRSSIRSDTGENRALKDVFEEHMLPGKLAEVFGDSIVREGGPVHVALQMLHSIPSASNESVSNENPIGGRIIPMIPEGDETSTALYSDRATYFQGEIFKAMNAVEEGKMDRDDISFFVGASTWSVGQLQNEIAQGFWIPCRGPPEIASTGICEHDVPKDSKRRPLADLWLSMMSACGEDEAKLAHLFYHEDELHPNGLPCDAFEEEDSHDF